MSQDGALRISYLDEMYTIDTDGSMTFGRVADLVVDGNPFMHRLVGRFESRDGRWWVCNLGTKIAIEVYDRSTRSHATLMPRTDQALPGGDVLVRFSAGLTNYELEVTCDQAVLASDIEPTGSETVNLADIAMTVSQRQLIVALAELRLREPQGILRVPPSKEAAARLGWSTTKFNRKLDNVCEKLTKTGVRGLKTVRGGELTTDRRRRLVDYAVTSGLVTPDDLSLLDPE